MPQQTCVRCGAQEGVVAIELAGVSTSLCLECSDVLTQAAAQVAEDIAGRAQKVAGNVVDHARTRGTSFDPPVRAWIAFEIAFFLLNLSDRRAFDALNEGLRVVFSRTLIDEVVPRLLSLLALTPQTARYNDVRQQLVTALNTRQLDYGARDATTVFVQFRAKLDAFFKDVAPAIHSDLTALGFARATDVWGIMEPALRQAFGTIALSIQRSPPHSATALRAPSPVVRPQPPPSQASSPHPGGQRHSYVTRLWRGEVSLPATFWGWGFALNLVFTLVLAATVVTTTDLFALLRAVYLAYYSFMVVAIWRSSERYTGDRLWSVLARIAVMVQLGRILLGWYIQLRYPL